jgi:acyl carrier protein
VNRILVECVSSVLDIEPEAVMLETSQENTPSWDSLAHIRLILEIEQTFGIRFRSQDIPKMTSIANLSSAVSGLGR